jgi:DNA-binding NtrC family response regulator
MVAPEPRRELDSARLLLELSGFRVFSAATFDEAKRFIEASPPDMLVTELKLGPYNGLHLVLRSRADHPRMGAIVTSHAGDRSLEAEAARQNAVFLVRPFTGVDVLNAVIRSFSTDGAAAVEFRKVLPF